MRLDQWIESLPDDPANPLDIRIKLVIASSPPRTKKNHSVLLRNITDGVLCKMIQEWEVNRPEPPRSMGKVEPISEETIKAFLEVRDTQLPHPRLFPSPQYQDWHRRAVAEMLPRIYDLKPYFPITCAVHCWVQIYRDRDTGDKIGYLQGLYDWLQDMGILADDRQVLSDDGSRMHTDPQHPRIELVISPFTREGSMGLFVRSAKEWAENEEPEPEPSVIVDSRSPEPPPLGAQAYEGVDRNDDFVGGQVDGRMFTASPRARVFEDAPPSLAAPLLVDPLDIERDRIARERHPLLEGMTAEQKQRWLNGEWEKDSADEEQRGGYRELRTMPKARQT